MQDGSWGLTFMIFTTMTFKLFITTTRPENSEFIVSLIWLFQYPKSLRCFSSAIRKSLPMGVKSEFICLIFLTMKSMILLIHNQYFPSSSGARPVLPMGVAPEAIVKKI
jgi:hypothetical protein